MEDEHLWAALSACQPDMGAECRVLPFHNRIQAGEQVLLTLATPA